MNYNQKVDLDTKFANWNGWYNDLFEEIKIIRRMGAEMFITPDKYIHRYYAQLLNLYSTHSSYIKKQDVVYKKLEDIKKRIYNDKFHRSLAMKYSSAEVLAIMSEMISLFTWINTSFQEQGIIPKVTATKKIDPGRAMEMTEY